jgi:low temperature requirement protein LtrA
MPRASPTPLRDPQARDHGRVTFVELFFDLVFVFAITQLSHSLVAHLDLAGALQTMLLLLAVWWVWIFTCWVTNWLDPGRSSVRVMLFALMLAGLVMSSAIPEAFGDQGPVFACAYVFMQVARSIFTAVAVRRHHDAHFRGFRRITVWMLASAVFWIWGGWSGSDDRFALWLIALGIEYLGPWAYFAVPGLGRSSTAEWRVDGHHMAERCALFVIIALGESILITGATAAELPASPGALSGFVVAFLGSVAMWWIYFNIGAERGSHHLVASSDPGRMARYAYTYLHALIAGGIVVCAVADELVIAHPGGPVHLDAAIAIICGPALYLTGNMLFKRTTASHLPLSHLIGLGLLAALIPVVPVVTPLILGAMTTAILIVVAVWETVSLGGPPRRSH